MLAALLAASPVQAQKYRFPGGDADYASFYPTAYKDHVGKDWNCGSFQYSGHNGTDFGGGSWTGMVEGRDIVAAAVGVVTATHDGEFDQCTTVDCPGGGGLGNFVQLVHPDGKTTVYGHLKKGSVAVAAGQFVQCGTLLGQMGSSGHSSGPHLHFGVKSMAGVWQDPFDGPCASPPSFWVEQGEYKKLPSATCDGPPPACEPIELISCGAVVQARNDAAGSTTQHGHYGCGLEWVYSGPEIGYRFVTDKSEPVTVGLTNLTGDLSVHVLESESCDGSGCIGYSDNSKLENEELVFQAQAGKSYVIMLDGFEKAVSDFRLTISCAGAIPGAGDAGVDAPAEGAAPLDATAGPDAEDASAADGADGGGAQAEAAADAAHDEPMSDEGAAGSAPAWDGASDPAGCGCAAVGQRATRWPSALALLAALYPWRRRRTSNR